MRNSVSKITGYVLIALAILVVIIVIYRNSQTSSVPVIFSSKDMLNATWSEYKQHFLEQGTLRTVDADRNDITTSEAESYALLRAVWLDDHVTFDGSWQWTKDNLQHKNDALFSWLFGPTSGGHYGILTSMSGENAASDADTDIALSLLFASNRWQDTKYSDEAKKIINDIWNKEVVVVNGIPYMSSDDVEHNSKTTVVLNPSYFAPYAYRIFAEVDKTHNWKGLVDSSYDVVDKSITSPLDKGKSAYIPPDWIMLDVRTGNISAIADNRYTTDYSYDALRVPWRLMLDYKWYKEPRALNILKKMSFLDDEWKKNGVIHSDYAHDGTVANYAEVPSTYGGSLAVLMAINADDAKKLYEDKLVSLFNPDNQAWRTSLGYYNENWVWFGLALYNDYLPNLWEGSSTRPVIPAYPSTQ